jgi:uncharacterized protein YaiI (UPF0178 family)
MEIWIDNDGCPAVSRELVFKVALRLNVKTWIIGNAGYFGKLPELIKVVQVEGHHDAADDYIVEHVNAGDLVITADVPLAGRLVEKGATGLSPRGDVFDASNIKDKLSTRNLMQELRGGGMLQGGGSAPYGPADKKRFADALDRLATKLSKSVRPL